MRGLSFGSVEMWIRRRRGKGAKRLWSGASGDGAGSSRHLHPEQVQPAIGVRRRIGQRHRARRGKLEIAVALRRQQRAQVGRGRRVGPVAAFAS